MGTTKALLRLEAATFFERVAVALAAVAEEVVVLGSGPIPENAARLRRLGDSADAGGPLAGALAAFAFAPDAAWILAACDQPLLDARALAWLVAQRHPAHWAIQPRLRGAGRVETLGALYESRAAARLRGLARRPGASLQSLAGAAGVAHPAPPEELAGAWTNVNTPADLARLARD